MLKTALVSSDASPDGSLGYMKVCIRNIIIFYIKINR